MSPQQNHSLLAYCVCEGLSGVTVTYRGVGGQDIAGIDGRGLRCYVSQVEETSDLRAPVQGAALVFHRVIEHILLQGGVIPFRFPTLFSSDADVVAHLADHSDEYLATLERIRDRVQMELKFFLRPDATPTNLSGTEYLRRAQQRQSEIGMVANLFREAASPWLKAWRQRNSTDGLHCFALIDRPVIPEFQTTLGRLPLPENIKARLSGPWPATQFLKEND